VQTVRNYLSRGQVIVNFVRKFVAMATGVGRENFLMTLSDSLSPNIVELVQTKSNYLS